MDIKNIQKIEDLKNALDIVKDLKPIKCENRWNHKQMIGLVSSFTRQTLPEAVNENSVDYTTIITVLVGAVQELSNEVAILKAKRAKAQQTSLVER